MPDDLRFSGAEANLVLHATEDESKLLRSIESILSISADRFSGESSEGHYKNKILLLNAMISSHDAQELVIRIISLLSSTDREDLHRNMAQYSDEKGNLYLRLDKQLLCKGKIALSAADSLRLRFRPIRRFKPSSNIEGYRGLLSSIE